MSNFWTNLYNRFKLTFSKDWVCMGKERKKVVIDETQYAEKIQPNIYESYKNVHTGEVREYRTTNYGERWVLKDG